MFLSNHTFFVRIRSTHWSEHLLCQWAIHIPFLTSCLFVSKLAPSIIIGFFLYIPSLFLFSGVDGLIYGPVMKAKSHQGLYHLITRLVIDQSVVSYTGPIIVLVSICQHFDWLINWVLTPLSAVFQLCHGDQSLPEYPERTTNPGQATGKLYRLRLQVECTLSILSGSFNSQQYFNFIDGL